MLLIIIISITKAKRLFNYTKCSRSILSFAYFFANQRQQQPATVAVAKLSCWHALPKWTLEKFVAYRFMFTVLNSLWLLLECVCVCECVCLVISESRHSLNWHSDLIIHFTLPSNVPITSSACCCCFCRVVLVVVVVWNCCLICFWLPKPHDKQLNNVNPSIR